MSWSRVKRIAVLWVGCLAAAAEPLLKLVSIKILGQEATTTEVGSKQTNQATDRGETNKKKWKKRPKAAKRQIKGDYERSRQAEDISYI